MGPSEGRGRMRDEDEIRTRKSQLQDLRHKLVEEERYHQAGEVNMRIETLLWVLGCDWNPRPYEGGRWDPKS